MKNKILRLNAGLISGISGVALSAMPFISLAQVSPPVAGPRADLPPSGRVEFTSISGAFCTVVAWMFTILIILAVIFILWAAWLYLSSGGEEEKIKKANHQLLYAAIAIIVAILSRGIPYLVGTFLGQFGVPQCG